MLRVISWRERGRRCFLLNATNAVRASVGFQRQRLLACIVKGNSWIRVQPDAGGSELSR
jgi:hypothetical protein